MPFNIGPGELIIILIIALVVLGPGKLPDVAASLGKGLREFRKAASDVTEAGKLDAPAQTPAAPAASQSAAPPAAPPSATQPAPASDSSGAAPSEPSGDSNQS